MNEPTSGMAKKSKIQLTTGDTAFYRFDAQLGFWGVPNLEREVTYDVRPNEPFYVRHNSDGNRDAEVILGPSEKTILCIGGSHTWGGGVQQDSRYSEVLAKRTGRRVLNLGHCSLGLDQVCLALLQKAAKYNPEIIIVEQYPWAVHRVMNTFVNGFVRSYFYFNSQEELKLQKVSRLAKYRWCRRLIGTYYAFRKEFQEFRSGIDLKNHYNPLTDPIFLYWKTRHYDRMYLLLDHILRVIRDYCNQHGIKLLFGLGAIQQQFGRKPLSGLLDYDLPRKRFTALLEKHRISYVDMTAAMLESHTPQAPVIFPDGHINTKGHGVFADILFSELQSRGWVTK